MNRSMLSKFIQFFLLLAVLFPTIAEGQEVNWDKAFTRDKYISHIIGRKSQGTYVPESTYQVGTRQMVQGQNVISQSGAAFGDFNIDTNQYIYTDWVGGPYHTPRQLCEDASQHVPAEWLTKIGCLEADAQSPAKKTRHKLPDWVIALLVLGGFVWLIAKLGGPDTPKSTKSTASDPNTAKPVQLVNAGVSDIKESDTSSAIEKLQDKLRKSYKVEFSRENEDVENQIALNSKSEWTRGGLMVKARQATEDEMKAIEAALEKSAPSHLAANGEQGVKFYFLKKPTNPSDDSEAIFIHKDKDGRPAVYIMPGNSLPATEKDRANDSVSQNMPHSLEATIVHELGHNTQNILGWNTSKNDPLPKTGTSIGQYEFDRKIAQELGFVYFKNPLDGSDEWPRKDKNSNLFLYKQIGADTSSNQWRHIDSQGKLMNKDGKPATSANEVHVISSQEMAQRSLVPPVTDYCLNPQETLAEGLQWFRLDIKFRAHLILKSPELYEVTKRADQLELNKRYGTEAGKPKMVRAPRGQVVPATSENTKKIENFESDIRKTSKR